MGKEDKKINFVKNDDIAVSIDSSFQKYISKHITSSNHISSSFDPAHITECPRKIVYSTNTITKKPDITKYPDGFIKEKWSAYLSVNKEIEVRNQHLQVFDCNYNICGQLDAVISFQDKLFATKIFPINDVDFNKVMESGAFKKHVVEIMIYMWLTELKDGLMIYDNKNDGQYKIYHVEIYAPIIQSIQKKTKELLDHKINGTIPNRPYKNESKISNECKGCEFYDKCWKENK